MQGPETGPRALQIEKRQWKKELFIVENFTILLKTWLVIYYTRCTKNIFHISLKLLKYKI